ncbi:MAG: GIY-YIG nuclease family protein [Marinagarivorans sp.]|nr:GIY-YIG nuclease family protein [Marinagarivorans sp.]
MPNNSPESLQHWHVYMLRCSDNSLYTGVTLNVGKRLIEHNTCNKKGAKYTRCRRPVVLAYIDSHLSKSQAYQREYQLKQLAKSHKEALVMQNSVTQGLHLAQALATQKHTTFTSNLEGEE